jgi:hypothetical protein
LAPLASIAPRHVRRTPGISCKAPILTGLVSFIPLFAGVIRQPTKPVRHRPLSPVRPVNPNPPDTARSEPNWRVGQHPLPAPHALPRPEGEASRAWPAPPRARTGSSQGAEPPRCGEDHAAASQADVAAVRQLGSADVAGAPCLPDQHNLPIRGTPAPSRPANTGDKLQGSNTTLATTGPCQLHPLVRWRHPAPTKPARHSSVSPTRPVNANPGNTASSDPDRRVPRHPWPAPGALPRPEGGPAVPGLRLRAQGRAPRKEQRRRAAP